METWKIPDGVTKWELSSLGRRRRLNTGKIIPVCEVQPASTYNRVTINGKRKYLHRVVADTFVENTRPHAYDRVDHINMNPRDNRAENLRWVTPAENTWNRRDLQKFCVEEGKYRVQIMIGGAKLHLGCFDTEQEAIDRWDEANRDRWEVGSYEYYAPEAAA
jgi:hypothetical protein